MPSWTVDGSGAGGSNTYGQLGLGHTETVGDDEHPSSEDVLALGEKVIQVSLGHTHACALTLPGKVALLGAEPGR